MNSMLLFSMRDAQKSSAPSKKDEQLHRDRQQRIITITIITQTHFANALPTEEGTTPPNAVFLVDEVATLAARGEKANALAEVATSASRANFFMMMAILGDEVGGGVGVGAHTKTTSTLILIGRRSASKWDGEARMAVVLDSNTHLHTLRIRTSSDILGDEGAPEFCVHSGHRIFKVDTK